jgi:hypothetical protein
MLLFYFYIVIEVLSGVAVSLGVGSSTFAIIFYFMGMRHPELHDAGRAYQKVVYIVLRVAMGLILLTELIKIGLYLYTGATLKELFAVDALTFIWTIVAVLFANAILMTLHRMRVELGPAIQATSWYTLGALSALPAGIVSFSYLPLLLTYAGLVLAAAVIIEAIRQRVNRSGEVAAVEAIMIEAVVVDEEDT